MSASDTFIWLLVVAFGALAAVSFANHLYSQQRLRRHRSLQLRRRMIELEEMALAVEPLVESLVIAKLINEENLAVTRVALDMHPNNQSLHAHLERAETLAQDFADESRPRKLDRLLESDAAIARAKYYISETLHILRRQQAKGRLDVDQLEILINELTWAHLMVQVISMVAQGHKAVQRGSALSASAFYRKAQQKLMDTPHSDRRRHPMIRQLGEILDGKRHALDEDLMPEIRFNPRASGSKPQQQAAAGNN